MKTMRFRKKILIILLVFFIAYLGGLFTEIGMSGWYQSLELPEWTPEGQYIGIAWTIIYVLLAYSIIDALAKVKEGNTKRFIHIGRWFAINLALNLLWSFVFFANQEIFLALIVAILLALSVYILIYLIRPVSKWAALALYPYAIWASFAVILNLVIWTLN